MGIKQNQRLEKWQKLCKNPILYLPCNIRVLKPQAPTAVKQSVTVIKGRVVPSLQRAQKQGDITATPRGYTALVFHLAMPLYAQNCSIKEQSQHKGGREGGLKSMWAFPHCYTLPLPVPIAHTTPCGTLPLPLVKGALVAALHAATSATGTRSRCFSSSSPEHRSQQESQRGGPNRSREQEKQVGDGKVMGGSVPE